MLVFSGANVDGCNVYGMSAWDLQLDGARQQNLIVRYRPAGEKEERKELVDGLDLAAFMYFTVSNENKSLAEAGQKSSSRRSPLFSPKRVSG
jgi:hypothetical protein